MFGFFTKKAEKREFNELKQAVQTGFNNVKQDVGSLSKWIKHLNFSDSGLKEDVIELKEELSTVKNDLDKLKRMISVVGGNGVFKRGQTLSNKQTVFRGVLNSVQTGVQTAFLNNLSATERAIIFILLNSDMKLSYEDLAAMLGKRKTTIRGQVNSIRQKSENLIEEVVGENNKKRVFMSDKIKNMLLKSEKVKNSRDKKE